MALTLQELNAAPVADAARLLDGLYEHSPWIAEAALAARPFRSLAHLKHEMARIVREAAPDRQLALIRAHAFSHGMSVREAAHRAVQRWLRFRRNIERQIESS